MKPMPPKKAGAMPKITPTMRKVFAGKETPKEEAAERRLVPGKAAYKKVEAKLEPGVHSKGKAKPPMMGPKR